jgi:hypothetical protein
MLAEHARVDAVHLLELLHVEQKDATAQHVLKIRAGGAENRAHVLEALRGLRGGIGTGEFAGLGIGRAWPETKTRRSKPMPGE